MKTQIQGIPCEVKYTTHSRSSPAKTNAAPEHCYPAEPAEIDFEVFDRKGYPAAWLEEKMTEEDVRRIEGEVLKEASQQEKEN